MSLFTQNSFANVESANDTLATNDKSKKPLEKTMKVKTGVKAGTELDIILDEYDGS